VKQHNRRNRSKRIGPTKLIEAVLGGTIEEVKAALSDTNNIEDSEDGFTPLMFAVTRGDAEIVEALIQKGSDVNARNNIGQSALMIAAKLGNVAVTQQLIDAGADVQAKDNENLNAIGWATSVKDCAEIVEMLARTGTDIDLVDSRGMTPLLRAALMGFTNAFKALIQLGADPEITYKGKTALQLANGR
jgi:uncharacterized protein